MVLGDDAAVRREWAVALSETLDRLEFSWEDLQRLLGERGCHVSRQAVQGWLAGRFAPRPTHQALIASVLQVPHRLLFPVPAVMETPK